MTKLVFKGGKSDKWWQIGEPVHIAIQSPNEPNPWRVTVKFGRTGTKGQTKSKFFWNILSAQRYASSKILEKRSKGYKDAPKDALPIYMPAQTYAPKPILMGSGILVPKKQATEPASKPCPHDFLNRISASSWACKTCLTTIEFDKPAANNPVPEMTLTKVRRFMDLSDLD